MASMTGAAAGLVTLGSGVSGIANSYGLANFFNKRLGVQLPCLIVVPDLQSQGGFSSLTFMGNAPRVDFSIEHYLLYKPLKVADLTTIMPGLFTMIDAYWTALAALPFLAATTAPAVHSPSKCSVKISAIEWGDTKYHGAIFRHDLMYYG